jgi:coniferyl-aldehyde dehydrogenase
MAGGRSRDGSDTAPSRRSVRFRLGTAPHSERAPGDNICRAQAYLAHPVPSLAERKADLRTLQRFVRENKDALCDAISADYGHRSRTRRCWPRSFRRWTASTTSSGTCALDEAAAPRGGPAQFLGARNRVIPQPLGVVGVIVPWNFPLNLSFVPLTYIFAAGNRAMVKMSENSRHLARC